MPFLCCWVHQAASDNIVLAIGCPPLTVTKGFGEGAWRWSMRRWRPSKRS